MPNLNGGIDELHFTGRVKMNGRPRSMKAFRLFVLAGTLATMLDEDAEINEVAAVDYLELFGHGPKLRWSILSPTFAQHLSAFGACRPIWSRVQTTTARCGHSNMSWSDRTPALACSLHFAFPAASRHAQ